MASIYSSKSVSLLSEKKKYIYKIIAQHSRSEDRNDTESKKSRIIPVLRTIKTQKAATSKSDFRGSYKTKKKKRSKVYKS